MCSAMSPAPALALVGLLTLRSEYRCEPMILARGMTILRVAVDVQCDYFHFVFIYDVFERKVVVVR